MLDVRLLGLRGALQPDEVAQQKVRPASGILGVRPEILGLIAQVSVRRGHGRLYVAHLVPLVASVFLSTCGPRTGALQCLQCRRLHGR